MLKGYLTKVDACPVCKARFDDLHADDGPAWFTMFFVGLLTVPVLIFLAVHDSFSIVISSFIVLIFITLLTLILLPIIKGVFIAVLWYLREQNH